APMRCSFIPMSPTPPSAAGPPAAMSARCCRAPSRAPPISPTVPCTIPPAAPGSPRSSTIGWQRRGDALAFRFQPAPALSQRAQPQRVEPDEAGRVAVVVGDGAFLEGDEVLVVERIRTLAPDHADIAFVELQAHARVRIRS